MECAQNKTSGILKLQTASTDFISEVNFFSCSPWVGSLDHGEDCNEDFVICMYEEYASICSIFKLRERRKYSFVDMQMKNINIVLSCHYWYLSKGCSYEKAVCNSKWSNFQLCHFVSWVFTRK